MTIGVAILWSKSIDRSLSLHSPKHERLAALKIQTPMQYWALH